MSTISHIDHIAIAVKSIAEVRSFYELSLGLPITEIEEMPERGIRVAFIRLGATTIELIEPLHARSEISSFLKKKAPVYTMWPSLPKISALRKRSSKKMG